jgi:hypothetical protein
MFRSVPLCAKLATMCGELDDISDYAISLCRRFPRLVRPTKGSSQAMRTPIVKSKIEVTRQGAAAKWSLELNRIDTDISNRGFMSASAGLRMSPALGICLRTSRTITASRS